jgi:hypothetical protein
MTAAAIAEGLSLRKVGRGWRGTCPAHGGSSFTLDERDGRPVFYCWSGCDRSAILAALRQQKLWPEPERRNFSAAERQEYARRRRTAELWAHLAGCWLIERLRELEEDKRAAIDIQAGQWDVFALAAAASEHYRLSTLTAEGVIHEWQRAREVDPLGTRTLESVGEAWQRTCERVARSIVHSMAATEGTRHVA